MAQFLNARNGNFSSDEYNSLSKSTISSLLPEIQFSRDDKRSKRRMLETVRNLPSNLRQRLESEVG
jgi:hypothetical protein